MKMTGKELAESKELLEDGRESVQLFRQMLQDQCKGDINVSMEILEEILTPLVLDAADSVAYDQVDDFEDKNDVNQKKVEAAVMARDGFSFRMLYNDAAINPDDTDNYTEETEEELKDIFSNLVTIILGERNIKILEEETEDNISKRLKYFTSSEYDKMLEKRRDKYEERLESEDLKPQVRRELQHKVAMIDDRYKVSFMMNVFGNSEKTKKQAIERLRKNFFDKEKSEYLMKRFFAKCHRYNIDPYAYKRNLDLEEKYLPEEYHPFNNFFLFIAISHIAYIYEENGGLEAYLVLGNMEKLFTNTFPTEESKQLFLDAITGMLDVFESYRDVFMEKNQLWSKHPMRIKKEYERKKQLREMLYQRIEGDELTEGGKITPEIEAMSVKELINFCNMRTEQKKYWESRLVKEKEINTLYDMVFTPYHVYEEKDKGYHFDQFGSVNDEEKKDYIIGLWSEPNQKSGTGVVAYDWRNQEIRFVGNFTAHTTKDITEKVKGIMDQLPKAVLVVGRGLGAVGNEIIDSLRHSDYMSRVFYTQKEGSPKYFGVMINRAVHDLMFTALRLVTSLKPELFRSGLLVDEISHLQVKDNNHVVTGENHSRVYAFGLILYTVIFLSNLDRYGIDVSGQDFVKKIYDESLEMFSPKNVRPVTTSENNGVVVPNPMFKLDETEKIAPHGVETDIKKEYPLGRGDTKPYIWPPVDERRGENE